MQKPVERLKRKVQKENLWFFILKLLKRQERYGFEIRNIIKKEFGFFPGNVTSYKVLYHMYRGGYVDFEKKNNKKYYSLTKKGERELAEAEKFLRSL